MREATPAERQAAAAGARIELATADRGGGSRGGHGGGSYRGSSGSAIARHPSARPSGGGMHQGSRPGYAPRGSVAQQRHPRAGWGYYGGSHSGGPGYSIGVYAPSVSVGSDDGEAPARAAERAYEGPSGRVRLEVRPDDASVYVDDEFRGTAREARILRLAPGRHQIERVRPGFATEQREVTVAAGESQDVLVELLRP